MSSCELCGADGVSTRTIPMHGALVEGCKQCQVKMGHNPESENKVQNLSNAAKKSSQQTSGGYGGLGTIGKDIMVRDSKELVPDFSKKIREARESKGWNQRTLALRMKEKINVIQKTESGNRPNDSLVKKFERTLNIILMIDSNDVVNEQIVAQKNSRSMNLGDFIQMARKDGD